MNLLRQHVKIAVGAAVVLTVVAAIALTVRDGVRETALPAASVAVSLPEKFGFSIACPPGTEGYERYGDYVCAAPPDGMWEAGVDVAPTAAVDALAAVQANNATLDSTAPTYMAVLQESTVGGVPAVIVTQSGGREGDSLTSPLPRTLLVVHRSLLYSVSVRESIPDPAQVFASFLFTK